MSKPVKCKFCPETFSRFDDLRVHCAVEHRETWHAVNQWLDRTTGESLRVHEALAREGMQGHSTGRDG
jgi:hypothetical protein